MVTIEADSISQNGDSTFSTPLTREALYELVWSEPMLKVAARFNVSSSYMARICTLLNVPRPKRGYWAKLAVGKAPPKPLLPDARAGDELVWSRSGEYIHVDKPLPRPPSTPPRRRTKMSSTRPGQHHLIKGAKEHFEAGRLSFDSQYLKPTKKLLVDLVVSRTGLEKAMSFANELFLALEDKGYHVVIAPHSEHLHRVDVDEHAEPRKNRGYDNNLWSPWRCTVVYIGTLAIGLTIIEMSEEVEVRYVNGKYIRESDYVLPKRGGNRYTWTTKKDYPTGRLCLQAYSPYWRAKWIKQWRETKKRDLENQIKSIVKELEQAAGPVARLVEEGERQAEIERQRWEAQKERWSREEAERKAAKALKESREELFQIIDAWAEANRIEKFFHDIEKRAVALSENERFRISERLTLARKLIGSVDALDYFINWRSPEGR